MATIFLIPLFIVIASSVFFVAAWLTTLIFPKVRDWSSLWAACVLVPLFIPSAGLALAAFAPAAMTDMTTSLVLHDDLPGLQALVGIGVALQSQAPVMDWSTIGMLALAVYGFGAALHLVRLVAGRWRVASIALAAKPAGHFSGIPVFKSLAAHTPFAWTPMARRNRSKIVFPATYFETFTTSQLVHIAEHECQHILRRDDEVGMILRVAKALLWGLPFTHAAFARWVQACEVQCDAAVLSDKPNEMRSTYAQTILQALHITANRVMQYPAASFSTHRLRNEKMRIRHIMAGTAPTFKHTRDRLALLGVAACLTLAGGAGFASLANADPAGAVKSDAGQVTFGAMVTGRFTAPYGKSFDPFRDGTTRVHKGIDIAGPSGTPILAPADGVILAATDIYDGKPAYGKVVVIETASDTQTMFAHLNDYSVSVGQAVKKGDLIAEIGNTGKSTGPHVHIETHVGGERVDPASVWTITE